MKLMKALNRYWFFLIAYGILLVFALLPFYQEGSIILGGEGNYWLDFSALIKNYSYAWQNKGVGDFNLALNAVFPNVLLLVWLQKIIPHPQVINFLIVFLLYFLPFLGMLKLCQEFKVAPFISFLASLFYVVNPFSLMFLSSLNQWNALVLFSLPLFSWVVLKLYHDNFKLFFYFGLVSLCLSFINVNPPLSAINMIAVVIFTLIVAFYLDEKLLLPQLVKKYFLLFFSFLFFNAWWWPNWLYILDDVQKAYTKQFALSWLRGIEGLVPIAFRTLNLTMLLPDKIDRAYSFFTDYYTLPLASIIFSIPLFILLYGSLKKKIDQKYLLLLALALFSTAFLVKGLRGVFGILYEYAIRNLPFFSIFKTAAEKWGVLYVFLFTLLLALIFKRFSGDRFQKIVLTLFLAYLCFCIFPLVSSNFIPDYKISQLLTGSRKFSDKKEYQALRNQLNDDLGEYRVLSLPGSLNYQVALQIKDNKFYTGNDPVLHNTNKAFVAPYNHSGQASVLFDSISDPAFFQLLGFFNIKKIVINKDAFPWFGFQEEESISQVEKVLDKRLTSSQNKKNEIIDLYDVGDYYLPRFYVPDKIIYSPMGDREELLTITSTGDFSKRTAVFINPEESEKRERFENPLVEGNASSIILVGDIRSTASEAKLRAGVKDINPDGVLFPYARWKPGSLIYPLVQKKEQKAKERVAGQPELLFEQHLFFAAKRIYEIQRWDKKFSDEEFAEVLARYQKEMQLAIESLRALKDRKNAFLFLVKTEVSFEAHKRRLLGVLEGDSFSKEEWRFQLANSVLREIENQLKRVIEQDYSSTEHYFVTSQDGEYEILAERAKISPDWKIENLSSDIESSFVASVSGRQGDKNWLSFGKRWFDFGKNDYFLAFVKPSSMNLLSQKWQEVSSEVEIDEEVKLFERESYSVVYQEIEDWQPRTEYKLSLKYRSDDVRLKVFLVEEMGTEDNTDWFKKGLIEESPKKSNVLVDEWIGPSSEWMDWEVVVSSGRNVQLARLFISCESALGKLSKGKLKEVKIENITEPKIILRQVKDNYSENVPQITFQKINPTKYVVDVEGVVAPYFLVFSESFHRGWQAYIDNQAATMGEQEYGEIIGNYFDGEIKEKKADDHFFDINFFQTWRKKPLPQQHHLTMNGYANSWLITPKDADGKNNYRVIIEYWPQRLFYLGGLIALITLVAALGVVCLRKVVFQDD